MNNLRSSFKHCWLLIAVVLANSIAANADEIVVSLDSKQIETAKSMVTIADVARIETANQDLAKKIRKLDLDVLVDRNSHLNVHRKQIEMRILVANLGDHRLRFQGVENVFVRQAMPVNTEKKIKTVIQTEIARQFGLSVTDIRVGLTKDKTAVSEDNDTAELLANIENALVILPATLPLGKTIVRFVYRDRDDNDKTISVRCRVTIATQMAVATHNISSGTQLTASDFRLVKRPLQDRRLRPAQIENIVGMTARSNIGLHDVIQVTNLTKTPNRVLVRRNDIVDLVYYDRSLKVTVKNARVLTSGAAGDRVEIVNPNSQKTVVASVVNKSLVEIR